MTSARRTIVPLLMFALISGPWAVFADDTSTSTDSTPAAVAPSSVPGAASFTDGGAVSVSATDTSTSNSNSASTNAAASTGTTTSVDDSLAQQTSSASATTSDTTTSVTSSSTPPITVPDMPSAPPAPSGDSLATTSSAVSATTTTSAATTSLPFQFPYADAASTTASTTASSTPTILSGDAVAVANIVNLLNTNIVNSHGALVLGNFFDPQNGTIDLRTGNPFSQLTCSLLSCDAGGIAVHVGDTASIDNAVVLSANSGGNNLTAHGNGVVDTGNAFAGLNLVNVANTNIVDSNYLLVTLNAFQGVNGDIVFPSLSNFLNQLAGGVSGTFNVDPTASVENTVTTTADSGGNTAQAASSTISTGSAQSEGNVFNRINTLGLGGGNVSILFRVQGNWVGQVFGAPQGLQWTRGADGSIMLFGDPTNASSTVANADFTGSSTARITNNVLVTALTGDNHVAVDGSALINTGNALAGANVVNVANTNIVGRNWILAVINIFGDFNGNIAFGRPDLWVGEQVSVPSFIQNGSSVTYKYTVINNGDSDATKATLTDAQDTNHIDVVSASLPYTTDESGHLVWELGDIPAGKAVEVSYQATVKGAAPGTQITDSATVHEHETDNNTADNSDTATIAASEPASSGLGFSLEASKQKDVTAGTYDLSAVTLTRDTATTTLTHAGTVHETLTVHNNGKAATPELTLHDIVRDPSGSILQDQSGSVGVLQPGDEVSIGYDLVFDANAPAGTYTLSSVINAGDMSALVPNNGVVILETSAATGHAGVHTPVIGSIVKTVAKSFTTNVAHAATKSPSNLAASAAAAAIPWQFALALFVIAVIAIGVSLVFMGFRRRY